jgi:hypothetical protein
MILEPDQNLWRNRDYWSQDYDSGREPANELGTLTRNAQTVRDALFGLPQNEWNDGTYGDCACDYSSAEDDFANVVPEAQDEDGVRYATTEEVERYYDQTRPIEDLRILKDSEGNPLEGDEDAN